MGFLYNNEFSFTFHSNSPLLYSLSHKYFPEFNIANEVVHDHLGDNFVIRTSLIKPNYEHARVCSIIKTLTHLFRGAAFLSEVSYSENEFMVHELYERNKKIDFNYAATPFTADLELEELSQDQKDVLDLKTYINFYLYLALRDMAMFKVLMFCSDRFDFVDLYKVRDTLNHEEDKMELKFLEPFKSELNKFGFMSNNFSATGFASRHGNSKTENQKDIDKNFISLEDSRKLFVKIVREFADERFKMLENK